MQTFPAISERSQKLMVNHNFQFIENQEQIMPFGALVLANPGFPPPIPVQKPVIKEEEIELNLHPNPIVHAGEQQPLGIINFNDSDEDENK